MAKERPECDICKQIVKTEDGAVWGHVFGSVLRRAYVEAVGLRHDKDHDWKQMDFDDEALDTLGKGPDADVHEAIARVYFAEFRDFYAPNKPEGITVGGGSKDVDEMMKRFDPKERLRGVLKDFPQSSDAWVVAHDDCMPESVAAYEIRLSRINTAEKAVGWTVHLSEKMQWDGKAWAVVLLKLFGHLAIGAA